MPICPHCKGNVTLDETAYRYARGASDAPKEVRREVKGLLKKEVMYSCPHCDNILGFSYFFGGLLTNRP